MLGVEQSIERILLSGIWEQSKEHALHRKVGSDFACVVLRSGQGMTIAGERDALFVVDKGGNAVLRLSLGGQVVGEQC